MRLTNYLNEQACMYHVEDDVYCIKYNIHHHEFKADSDEEAEDKAKEYMKSILPCDVEIEILDFEEEE